LVLGKAKVMSYEDLEEARAKRGRKRKSDTLEAEEDTAETARRGRKRKSATQEPPEPSSKVARATVTASVVQMSGTPIAEDEIVPEPWRAPVARMY
jgi:FtsZ-interacting cell division protein YlmF